MKKCKKCENDFKESDYRTRKNSKGCEYVIGTCRECERKYQKIKYHEDIELSRKIKRDGMKKQRDNNIELSRKKQKNWCDNNREKVREKNREYYHKSIFWSRSMKLKGENRATSLDLENIWNLQEGKCALTNKILDKTAHIDHILPKSKGGLDIKENLRWVCKEVNLSKRDLTDEDFLKLCEAVINNLKK